MEEYENIYEKISELMGGLPANLKVLEHQVDLELQMEYYECSARLRNEHDEQWAVKQVSCLDDDASPDSIKKEVLARLASINRVECYRLIEAFSLSASENLRSWALLAQNESRMLLESRIMEENQVFISTGLGGKEEKLRYFVVLISRLHLNLTESQQKVIRNEFDDTLSRFDAEVEEVVFSGYLATLLLLIPMRYPLKSVFSRAIEECNQYGNFLHDDFIVTNVRTLSFDEIEDFLERRKQKGKGQD